MKESPDEKRIRGRMTPGVLSHEGFLGADPRRVSEIIEADAAAAERLGTSLAELAARLEAILDAAVAALGTPAPVGDRLTATWHEAMGRIPCPFGRCGTFPKGEIEVADLTSGQTLRFTPLSVHLIAEHGFCQGRGSPYRLEPETWSRTLGILKD